MATYYEEKFRRSSYTSKYSATSMTSIAEDEDNADDTLLDSRRGGNVDGIFSSSEVAIRKVAFMAYHTSIPV